MFSYGNTVIGSSFLFYLFNFGSLCNSIYLQHSKKFGFFSYRGGKYAEYDAKVVMIQILNVVAFCHLQGVVHRDLKPEVGIFWVEAY